MDNIANRASFAQVRYANCWEDAEILCAALQPGPGRRFLSIASAGDNSLALLAHGAEVVAADLSPAQLACVALRQAAVRRLDHSDCLAFLGVTPDAQRRETYAELRGSLSAEVARYWDAHPEVIRAGIIHQGKFERYFSWFRHLVLPLVHPRPRVARLLAPRSREERRRFYAEVWDNRRWRLLFRVFFSRFFMGRLGRDPEFFRYVEVPVSENLAQRARYALTELPTHTNPYLEYILTGNFTRALPCYLHPEIFAAVKANIDNLHLYHGSIQGAAAAHLGGGFDGFNLSDIFEYLDQPTCAAVYGELLAAAKPGARLVYWNMLVPRQCPEEFRDRVRPLEELAATLFARDQAFFYSRFLVEEVR